MIISRIPDSSLMGRSPWNGVFCDLSSILCIRRIRIIILIDHHYTLGGSLLVSYNTEEYSDMFLVRFRKGIIGLAIKTCNHQSLIGWWKYTLRRETEIKETHSWKPCICWSISRIWNHLRECGTLPCILSSECRLRKLWIHTIPCIRNSSRIRWMHHHKEIGFLYRWTSYE